MGRQCEPEKRPNIASVLFVHWLCCFNMVVTKHVNQNSKYMIDVAPQKTTTPQQRFFKKMLQHWLSFSKGIYAHNADSPNVVTGDINTTKHYFSCWMWSCELGTISKSPVPIPFHDNFIHKSTMSEKLQSGQCVRQSRPQWRIHRNLNKQTMWHSSN